MFESTSYKKVLAVVYMQVCTGIVPWHLWSMTIRTISSNRMRNTQLALNVIVPALHQICKLQVLLLTSGVDFDSDVHVTACGGDVVL